MIRHLGWLSSIFLVGTLNFTGCSSNPPSRFAPMDRSAIVTLDVVDDIPLPEVMDFHALVNPALFKSDNTMAGRSRAKLMLVETMQKQGLDLSVLTKEVVTTLLQSTGRFKIVEGFDAWMADAKLTIKIKSYGMLMETELKPEISPVIDLELLVTKALSWSVWKGSGIVHANTPGNNGYSFDQYIHDKTALKSAWSSTVALASKQAVRDLLTQ